MQSIHSLISDPEVLLALEPEELAGFVLEIFNSSVREERGLVSAGNFISQEWLRDYPHEHQNGIRYALVEALVWLENEGLIAQDPGQGKGWVFITRQGRRVKRSTDLEAYLKTNLLPKQILHPVINHKSYPLFLRGEYDTAVFQAFKEVEVFVRDVGNYTKKDYGVSLMRQAFHPKTGKLTDVNQLPAEQDAVLALFAGSIGLYKNPSSHRNIDMTAVEAAEAIIFASHLLKIVDSRQQHPIYYSENQSKIRISSRSIEIMQEYDHDVVLSFAGEDRHHAEELAALLKKNGYKVFYDKYELAQLWGKNLYTHLSSVYKDNARYCVMFLSEHYARKLWTNRERESAQARAFEENEEYILPVRLDDTEIPGILPTVGYLDLRSMSINGIYQVLVEKLSSRTPQIVDLSSVAAENDPGEFMLLCSANGQIGFLPLLEARRDSTSVSAKLLPESPQDTSFLRSLRDNYNRRFGFAYQADAAWGSIQEIVETTSGSQTVCEVILDIDDRNQGYDFFSDVTVNGISPDQIAEMRARRILLDEKLENVNLTLSRNIFDQTTLEIYIRGMSSASHEPTLQVTESSIPNLYRHFGQTPERFKKFARLISILYLKLSNTVENILRLDLELIGATQLQVKFKGIRPKFYSNVEPSTIEFEGICSLPE